MVKMKQEEEIHPDGWSRWVYPIMDGYKLSCCDCGLVHDMQFRVTDDYDRVEFRVRRNNRSTGQVRRRKTNGVSIESIISINEGMSKYHKVLERLAKK